MQSTLDNIHNKLSKFPDWEHNPAMSVVLEEINKSKQSLRSLNTEYKIKKSIPENPLFISPEEIVLGQREEVYLRNGAINNITVSDKACYVPTHSIIKNLVLDEKFATVILNENFFRKTTDEVYSNSCDSRKFKRHKLFSDKTKISLRIQLFYDGMETTNPLRGHTTIHNVGVFILLLETYTIYTAVIFKKLQYPPQKLAHPLPIVVF